MNRANSTHFHKYSAGGGKLQPGIRVGLARASVDANDSPFANRRLEIEIAPKQYYLLIDPRLVIIIVISGTEPACQSIDFEDVGSSVLGAHRHDEPSASYDLNVRPSIRHQLLPDLFFAHRPAALDEHRAPVALRCRDHKGGGSSCKQHCTRNRPYDRSFHGSYSWQVGIEPPPRERREACRL